MGLRISAHFMQDVTGNLFHNPRVRFIPIRASRVGCDAQLGTDPGVIKMFQSTHPVWDATPGLYRHRPGNQVSIHAPRVGCDKSCWKSCSTPSRFNPRTPCGMRRRRGRWCPGSQRFQSTHPVWDATPSRHLPGHHSAVSIHAPRVGCDGTPAACARERRSFNPRTPCGMRLRFKVRCRACSWFQSTHPVWDATEI